MLGLGDLWRNELRAAVRRIVAAAACALCVAMAVALLCVAGFVVALERFGLVYACIAAAVAFLLAALLVAAVQAALAERRRRRRREAAAAAPLAALADPRAILIGLQVAQTIGLKRLAPLLAVGAAAFALSASRRQAERRRAGLRRSRQPAPSGRPTME